MSQPTPVKHSTYVLGHSSEELDRLIRQEEFFGSLTAQVLRQAGLGAGMRVLDIGCGAGDVSFLAAHMVGLDGMVIGVDKSPQATNLATQRAGAAGLSNVQFLTHDFTDLVLEEPVDALIGRLVLMYCPDPAVVLRRLLGLVRPGGLIAFHEFHLEASKSDPACAIFETTFQRIKQTSNRAGVETSAGLKLPRIFLGAGLPTPEMILGARVECGPASLFYDVVAGITRTLLPIMQSTGVATAEEVGIETLADRMREEAVALNATLVSPAFIGAWARKKGVSDLPI